MHVKDKRPYNQQRQRNGYWEVYNHNGDLWYIQNYINDEFFGYFKVNSDNAHKTILTERYYAR